MVLCGLCKTWQHAVCFALLQEEEVPELHVCDLCAQVRPLPLHISRVQLTPSDLFPFQLEGEGGRSCTDSFLQFLSPIALQVGPPLVHKYGGSSAPPPPPPPRPHAHGEGPCWLAQK